MFGAEVAAAAKAHAIASFPRESVGFVIGGAYVPQENRAGEAHAFAVADEAWGDDVQAVIHSHVPPAILAPSAEDMSAQLASAVPWGITLCSGDHATDLLWFGDEAGLLEAPLLGRVFVPGVNDCYSLVRSWFHQRRGVLLPEFARAPLWWEDPAADILAESFLLAGFVPIDKTRLEPGDALGFAYQGRMTHCGLIDDDGLLIHHRAGQLSRREPYSGSWRRMTKVAARLVL